MKHKRVNEINNVGIEPLLWKYHKDSPEDFVYLREPTAFHYFLRKLFGRYFYPND